MEIKNIDDVKNFIWHVINDLNVNFHPDTDFRDYINLETEAPSFPIEVANNYNKILAECFTICEREFKDVYLIGQDLLFKSIKLIDY